MLWTHAAVASSNSTANQFLTNQFIILLPKLGKSSKADAAVLDEMVGPFFCLFFSLDALGWGADGLLFLSSPPPRNVYGTVTFSSEHKR